VPRLNDLGGGKRNAGCLKETEKHLRDHSACRFAASTDEGGCGVALAYARVVAEHVLSLDKGAQGSFTGEAKK